MKNRFFAILLVLIVSSAVAGAFLDFFHAKSEANYVKLEWKTSEESNIKEFQIERRTTQSSYVVIGRVQPKGNNSYYSFLDENSLKPNDLVFVYRLKILDNDNQISYSKEVTVSHNISGIKRTWGSIKAMFR